MKIQIRFTNAGKIPNGRMSLHAEVVKDGAVDAGSSVSIVATADKQLVAELEPGVVYDVEVTPAKKQIEES